MPSLINNKTVLTDHWTLLKEATGPEILSAVSGKNLLVPLEFWQFYPNDIAGYQGDVSIWLDSHELVASISKQLDLFPVIALNFPTFADGRSYSNARQLRQELNYQGEIRAIGDVLRDQLFYMHQCGFDTFALRYDQDSNECLSAFSDFSTNYQATTAQPLPLFRRR